MEKADAKNTAKNIKVIILCGGLGTRLREETEFRPKPMVNIGDRPILWHIMKIYAHYGYKNFILSLGYKGEMIKKYFYNYQFLNSDFTIQLGEHKNIELHNNHDEYGWRITLADTGAWALKGARLKRIEQYIDNDVFMVTYGDGVADIDINSLVDFHRSHGKMATVTGINPASRFGELKIDGDTVNNFIEKPETTGRLLSGGFFVFNRQILDEFSDDDSCDLETGIMEKIAREGQLMVYKHEGFWACMDTYRDVEYLNRQWGEEGALWKVW